MFEGRENGVLGTVYEPKRQKQDGGQRTFMRLLKQFKQKKKRQMVTFVELKQ